LYHDECAVHANDTLKGLWLLKGTTPEPRPKGKGKGMMISCFISEPDGLLRYKDGFVR